MSTTTSVINPSSLSSQQDSELRDFCNSVHRQYDFDIGAELVNRVPVRVADVRALEVVKSSNGNAGSPAVGACLNLAICATTHLSRIVVFLRCLGPRTRKRSRGP